MCVIAHVTNWLIDWPQPKADLQFNCLWLFSFCVLYHYYLWWFLYCNCGNKIIIYLCIGDPGRDIHRDGSGSSQPQASSLPACCPQVWFAQIEAQSPLFPQKLLLRSTTSFWHCPLGPVWLSERATYKTNGRFRTTPIATTLQLWWSSYRGS